ncbi:MAG: hypothetical protein H6739_05630 [Alphaproteobacteria bacterium]|nr:hypothetical protein [Alphaproteobacteria bacterium]
MRVLILTLGVVGLVVGCAVGAQQSTAPLHPPLLEETPAYAAKQGYDSYRHTQGGSALEGWADLVLARNPPRPDGPLLVDRYHATKQPEDSDLGLEDYSYPRMHGMARAFTPLTEAGVAVEPVTAPWTARRLGGASAVFINLVSGNNPGFRWSEVVALDAFVRAGGGLFLVTDHSNCYFHAEMLRPLAERLGFELRPETAADQGPGRTLSPSTVAWLRMLPVVDHPVTRGVRAFGFMTGGAPRPAGPFVALATTSEQGWADRWDPWRKPKSAGFTGDLEQQDDEPSEAVPTVIAGQVGQGRVVVFGDQNALGATLIGFEETHRLFANAMGWLIGRDLPVEIRGPASVTTLTGPRFLCTAAAPYAYRTLQVQLQRVAGVAGRPEFCTADGPLASRRLLVLPEATRGDLGALLEGAERAAVLLTPGHPAAAWAGLEVSPAEGPAASGFRWLSPLEGPPHAVFSSATLQETGAVAPAAVVGADLEVLAEDTAGRPLVIRTRRGDTELLLVLDPALLANARMGNEREKPQEGAPELAAAHRTALRLMQWLVG